MVYKVTEVVVQCEESGVFNDIEDIITKYSKPYEDIYESGENNQWNEEENAISPVSASPAELGHTPGNSPPMSRGGSTSVTPSSLDNPIGT